MEHTAISNRLIYDIIKVEGKMKKKTKIMFLLCFMIIYTLSTKTKVYAAEVPVTLPAFDVALNGIKINNEYRQYPLIVYKDITYFPMTYFDSRFLGIETKWDDATGLEVTKISETSVTYEPYTVAKKNTVKYTAAIPAFSIKVNGTAINNSNEKYPLLKFRDVTYFPMTWKFAVDEFGWNYSFSNKDGLIITNPKYIGLKATDVELPLAVRDGGSFIGDFIVAGKYYYYEGEKGIIYQSPTNNPADRKNVYELPLWTYGDSYVYASLETVDDRAILSYHQGGASMGTDFKIILNEDGTSETFSEGYSNRRDFGDYIINVCQFVPPSQNNLSIREAGEAEYKPIGDNNYIYGWVWSRTENSEGGSPSKDIYLIGDDLYVLAYYKPRSEYGTTGIHKVNIQTGETTRLCEESAVKFIICDDIIYFMDNEGHLYKLPPGGNIAERLTDFNVSDFTVLNHIVYYVSADDKGHELFKLGQSSSLNPGGIVKSLYIQNGYVASTFEESSNSKYKVMILNSEGKEVFKSPIAVKKVIVDDDQVFFYSE
jgi:hypothetical protein